jgi:hypothetical protein
MPDEFQPTIDPFKLVFENHNAYFFACVEAEFVTEAITLKYYRDMALEISKRRCDRVMIKRDVPMTNNVGDHCAVIYLVAGWQMRRIRYAFVDLNPGHISSYALALLYAHDNGVQAKVFGDVPSAREWLLC